MKFILNLKMIGGTELSRIYDETFFTNNDLEYIGRNIVDMADTLMRDEDTLNKKE